LAGATVLAALVMVPTPAAAQSTTRRPISDFLSRQGTHCLFGTPPNCFEFQTGIPNIATSTAPASGRLAHVDYPGVIARFVREQGGPRLGTKVDGKVTERRLGDGRALVEVSLETDDALFWVSDIGAHIPPADQLQCKPNTILFGRCYQDVIARRAGPTVGESYLELRFTNSAPGAPLPDLIQLGFEPQPGQELRRILFKAKADGPLSRNFGVRDGTPGRATVSQRCDDPCAPNFVFQEQAITLARNRRD